MGQLRKATDDEDALTAAAKAIRNALAAGRLWPGPELRRVTVHLDGVLRDLNDAWPASRREVFSFVGYHVQLALSCVFADRLNEAAYQQRQRERGEAQAHPLDDLLKEEGVEKISDLIRRQVATADAVRHSDGR